MSKKIYTFEPPVGKVYYLASPYSTPKHKWIPRFFMLWYRHHIMQKYATVLTKQGHILIEPISMCFYKSLLWNLPQTYAYWQKRDRTFIDKSVGVIVCNIKGWDQSVGVTDEIAYAKQKGKTVYLVTLINNNPEYVILF